MTKERVLHPVPRKKRKEIGIHGRLFLYLTLFIVFVLLLIWLFQIHLLGFFYEATKYEELDRSAGDISYFLDDEESLKNAVYDYASRYNICITVYRLDQNSAKELVRSHISGACAVHQFSDSDRVALYESAMENDGTLSVKYTIERRFFERNAEAPMIAPFPEGETLPEELPENPLEDLPSNGNIVVEESVNAVSVHIIENSLGQQYILMLDSKLTPVSSLIETLELQFLWLAGMLLLLALGLAFLISHLVSRPIVSMNRSAKRLAMGDYHEVFVGAGFRETRELAETLNYASVELSKNDKLQKDLIANISHDLRTPLTMIKGYSEVMRDIPEENTPENIQVVIDEAERMNELVSDLLDLSKIQAGHRVPAPQVLNLTELVETTLRRYDKLIEHDGFDITFEGKESAYVYADDTMILQALYNLINNAINYTGDDRLVTVTQTVADQTVRISVTDTGEGIDEDQIPLIWDRYYKVDKTHKRAMIGTGLGLSIVKGILELHEASYGVESIKGEGSTFWFSLPILGEETEKNSEEA